VHPLVEEQVFGGMSGAIVVEGLRERLGGLSGVTERIMELKDLQIDRDGRIPSAIDSDAPTVRTVNGQVRPTVAMRPGEVQLWRIANVGADIWYRLVLRGHALYQVAEDGNPLRATWRRRVILLPPGKRAEVLVRAGRPGVYRLETLRYSTGPEGDTYPRRTLARRVVSGAPEPPRAIPSRIQPFRDLRRVAVDRRRTIVFSENPAGTVFFIDGRRFSHHRIDQRVRLGAVEEWTIRNTSGEQHPFHIHQGDFQVVRVNGRPVAARGLQDTVPLPVHGSVTIRMRFAISGTFVFHCHILAHEDGGMMAVVRVA
jgi:FtsP/CotA-like multicopper oxidase with cupredoxin domain